MTSDGKKLKDIHLRHCVTPPPAEDIKLNYIDFVCFKGKLFVTGKAKMITAIQKQDSGDQGIVVIGHLSL